MNKKILYKFIIGIGFILVIIFLLFVICFNQHDYKSSNLDNIENTLANEVSNTNSINDGINIVDKFMQPVNNHQIIVDGLTEYYDKELIIQVDKNIKNNDIKNIINSYGQNIDYITVLDNEMFAEDNIIKVVYNGDVKAKDLAKLLKTNSSFKNVDINSISKICKNNDFELQQIPDYTINNKQLYNSQQFANNTLNSQLNTTYIDDPKSSEQWALDAVGAYEAWDLAKSNNNSTIIVIDSGIDINHEDLAPNIQNILPYAYNAVTGQFGVNAVNDSKIGHGTHCAGIISACTNNNVGISGVSYNANVLPIKVIDDNDGSISVETSINAYKYIIEILNTKKDIPYLQNIAAISMSYGCYEYSDIANSYLQEIYKLGPCLVASAGNECTNDPSYPASFDNVVSVASINQFYNKSEFSNFGETIDIAAPGESIMSTYLNNSYKIMSGTSMACPYVSGIIGLLRSTYKNLNQQQVLDIIFSTALDLGSSGWDDLFGYGLIRADRVLYNIDGILDSGNVPCKEGDSKWKLFANGELEISGDGCPIDFKNEQDVPWHIWNNNIKSIVSSSHVAPESYSYWFCNMENLVDISNCKLDFYNVVSADCMFKNCKSLNYVDFTNQHMDKLVTTKEMFSNCTNLKEIWINDDLSIIKAENSKDMFKDCIMLKGDKGTKYDPESKDSKYAKPDTITGNKGYFSIGSVLLQEQIGTNVSFCLYNSGLLEIKGEGTCNTGDIPAWFQYARYINKIKIDSKIQPTTLSFWFANTDILHINLNNIDTSHCLYMKQMLLGCLHLKNVDLSNFVTNNVIDMSGMFAYCTSINYIDIKNLCTKNVLDMSEMFLYCNCLSTLSLNSFNTNNVKSMTAMFYECQFLDNLDISMFDFSKVEEFSNMFCRCSFLNNLKVSNLTTYNAKDMSQMFANCYYLQNINLSKIYTNNVINMQNMFANCHSLSKLDVSAFNTKNTQNMSGMFYKCFSLEELDLRNFDVTNVKKFNKMLSDCYSIKCIKSDKDWFSKNSNIESNAMFNECVNLVGGNGTKYSDKYTDLTYARIDNDAQPGYFTCLANSNSNVSSNIHNVDLDITDAQIQPDTSDKLSFIFLACFNFLHKLSI